MPKFYISNKIQFVRGCGALAPNPSGATHMTRSDAKSYAERHGEYMVVQVSCVSKRKYVVSTKQKFIGNDNVVVSCMTQAKSFGSVIEASRYIDNNPCVMELLHEPFIIDEKYRTYKQIKPSLTQDLSGNSRMVFSQATRKLIYDRGNICAICGKPVDESDFTVDHIVPLSRGGSNALDNLRPTHRICNMIKSNYLDTEMFNVITDIGCNQLYNSPMSNMSNQFIRAIVRGTIRQLEGGDIYRKIRMENKEL